MEKGEQDDMNRFPSRLYCCCFACLDAGQDYVIERFGKHTETLGPGCHTLCCGVHHIAYAIDKKEIVLNIEEGEGYTKDNVSVRIQCSVNVKFMNTERAAQGAKEPLLAIREFTRAVVRSAVGKMDLNTIFENRNAVTKEVIETMQNAVQEWGALLVRFNLTMVEPADQSVVQAMHKQVSADREKNETIINSEATKESMIKQADANFQSTQKAADAYEQKQQMEGEGDKDKMIKAAEAEKESIQMIAKALEVEGGDYSQRMRLSEQYLRQFGNISYNCQTMIVPADTGKFVDTIKKMGEMFSGNK